MILPQDNKIIVLELKDDTGKHLALTKSNEKDRQVIKGKVIRAGEKVKFCKPSDVVYYTKYAGFKLELEGKEYLIIEEEQLLEKVD